MLDFKKHKKGHIEIIVVYIAIFLLPVILFYWMLPFISTNTIGNDFQRFPINNQIELQFSIENGCFPLFAPGFAGGQSAIALTLGQFFHPISYIAASLPGYWEGNALEIITLLRLITLFLAHCALFLFISKLGVNSGIGFALSTLTVYNLRTLDLFRYGASLESWTGYLFLCLSIGWLALHPKQKKSLLFIICATYWLVCSGHPQMMYFGMIGSALFTLIIPLFLNVYQNDRYYDTDLLLHFYLKVGACIGVGILLSSSYLLPFYFDFIVSNAGRVQESHAWSNLFADTLIGTINNFIIPTRSDVGAAFGSSAIIILPFLLPVLLLCKVRIPKIIWAVWVILLFAFLFLQGARTPVHHFIWKYFPFFSSFRVAGRISMIMPVFILLILLWTHKNSIASIRINRHVYNIGVCTILTVTAILLWVVYGSLPDNVLSDISRFSPKNIRNVSFQVELIIAILGALSLLSYMLYSKKQKIFGILLCLFVCMRIAMLYHYGIWQEPKRIIPSLQTVTADKKESLDYRYLAGIGLMSKTVKQCLEFTCLEPYLAKLYYDYSVVDDTKSAYEAISKGRTPEQLIIEKHPSFHLAEPNKVNNRTTTEKAHIKLVHSTFNRLDFEVYSPAEGFLGSGYPWSGNWSATMNDIETTIYRANGAYQAIRVPEGESTICLKYDSRAMRIGIIISLCTLVLLSFVPVAIFPNLPARYLIPILCIVSCSILYMSWEKSLYNGDNIGTAYYWNPYMNTPSNNLAYAKKTKMDPIYLPVKDIFYSTPFHTGKSSGLAVDGNRKAQSGFLTNVPKKHPKWAVDLGSAYSIGRIAIFEGRKGIQWNTRPIKVYASTDGDKWAQPQVIFKNTENGLDIIFDQPFSARYIGIEASGVCRLSFDEVEVYSPGAL